MNIIKTTPQYTTTHAVHNTNTKYQVPQVNQGQALRGFIKVEQFEENRYSNFQTADI